MKENDFSGIAPSSTDRLHLRRPTREDHRAVYLVHSNPLTNLFNPHGPDDLVSSERMLIDWISHWETYGYVYWAVSFKETLEQVIGFGGLARKKVGDRFGLNLYFRFAPDAWGKGLATEIATEALSFAFTVLGESEVLAKVRANNLPSRRVLERIGMSIVGECEDVPNAAPSLIYAASMTERERRKP